MKDLALIPQASLAVRSKVARRCRCVFATLAVRQSRLGQSARWANMFPTSRASGHVGEMQSVALPNRGQTCSEQSPYSLGTAANSARV